jgi:hypothetical protein
MLGLLGAMPDFLEYEDVGSCVAASRRRAQWISNTLQRLREQGQLPYNAVVCSETGYFGMHTYNVVQFILKKA